MPKRLPSRGEVLELLEAHDRPLHAREIASQLNVADSDYLGFQRMLDDLGFQGVVSQRPGQRFKAKDGGRKAKSDDLVADAAPLSKKAPHGEREGILSVNARGFGFVSSLGDVGDDVFIGAEALGGAMHGDKVVVRVRSRSSRGVEGEIVKVVTRGMKRVAGVLRRRGKSAWVEPDDTRVRGPVTLVDEIDTRGAEGNSGSDGDAVIVTITRYPDFTGETPQGKIEAVLGRPGELKVEVAKILVLERIEELHTDKAFAEADAYGAEVPVAMKEGREDLTHLPLPTIDPEDARDHDDAVWVERTPEGGYRCWIAIADVSSYVVPGTAIDAESKVRGVSVYLPDRAIPMLPRNLSSNLCSLLPDVERLCLCADVTLDASGSVVDARLVRGVMKSQAKLNYGGVARALGFTELPPRQAEADAMKDGLRVAYEASRLLRAKRMKRGALDFDLPEAKIILDDKGEPTDITRRSQDPGMKRAYQLIEELMILANEVVARWFEQKQLPAIFRVHAAPDEKKLDRFAALCEALGIPFDVESTREPKLLAQLLKSFADHPLAATLNSLLLRSMKQATYDINNIGHFGLASKAYLHFTSPIRRYPDLVVHRMVHKILLAEKIGSLDELKAEMAESALNASMAERRAMEVERAVVDLYRAFLMKDKIGERYEGTVSAVVGSGMFVALDAPFVDVLVRLEDVGTERYEIDEEGLRIVGARSGDAISLGDRVLVEIIDVAILRRSVYGKRIHEGAPTNATRGNVTRNERRGGPPKQGQGQGDARGAKQGRNAKPQRGGKPQQRGTSLSPARGPQAVDNRVDRANRKSKKDRIQPHQSGGKKKGKKRR
jgi:ribonuclease R